MPASKNKDELLQIIDNRQLTSVFQPIVDLHQHSLFGYEALIKGPTNSIMHSSAALFDTANKYDLLTELEYACRDIACTQFIQTEAEGKLFLNISPANIIEKSYCQEMAEMISQLGLPSDRVVIELSEQYPLNDYMLAREATDYFRAAGFQIAIDDLGAGYASLRSWSEIRPDYVKIDQHFIEHIHRDTVKREFVRSILEISQELNCKVIAKGVEFAEDLITVKEMGLRYGQGFFIGHPEIFPENKSSILNRIAVIDQLTLPRSYRFSEKVDEITLNAPSVNSNTPLTEVSELFQKDRRLTCLPIVDQTTAIGIVDRNTILELFSQRYSRELHGRKPVKQFLSTECIIVGHNTSLEDVSHLITDGHPDQLVQDFIVTRDNQYYGIGKTSTLLKRITAHQIRSARYANPLTMLPGNVPLHEKLEDLLKNNTEFRIAYFDLNFFKPYNDHYGYSRGDDVIVGLSKVLLQQINSQHDTLFHIGGDDFVIIYESTDWNSRCQTILDKFCEITPSFYSSKAIKEGGIWGINRTGDKHFFSLLSLAIGIAHPDTTLCKTYHDVAELAGDAKKQAKLKPGNNIFYCQRRTPSSASLKVKKEAPYSLDTTPS